LYQGYYAKKGADRNDLLANPEVTFQTFALDRANIRALRRVPLDRDTAQILDVGCGNGSSLLQFIRLGFLPENLSGVDTDPERIAAARANYPNIDFRLESAEALSWEDSSFDLVFESTLFVLLTSDELAADIASEMLRVTRPGGHIMLTDWRFSKPGSGFYKGMSRKRIRALFEVGHATEIVARERGALVPPVGRLLSRHVPTLYFMVQRLLPFATGQFTTVLRKKYRRGG